MRPALSDYSMYTADFIIRDPIMRRALHQDSFKFSNINKVSQKCKMQKADYSNLLSFAKLEKRFIPYSAFSVLHQNRRICFIPYVRNYRVIIKVLFS